LSARAAGATGLEVLHLGLPDGDGLLWVRAHPQGRDPGLEITSARSDEGQRIEGLKQGADLSLVEPVAWEELAWLLHRRLRTKLRESLGLKLPLETAHRLGAAFAAVLKTR
jgi:DNA-binding response OmpR family regulator